MKARVLDGAIAELFAGDLTKKFHPDIIAMLVDVPENVQAGWVKIDGVWCPKPPFLVEDKRTLEQLKSDLCTAVDDKAESIRTRYATMHAGLAMTYQEKFAQANAVDAMGQDAANALTAEQMAVSFPILAASVGIEAGTLWDVAQIVIAKYQQWSQLAGLIERTRLLGKRDINAASTREDAQAVYGALVWPS